MPKKCVAENLRAGIEQGAQNALLVVAAQGVQLPGRAVFDPLVADAEPLHPHVVAAAVKERRDGFADASAQRTVLDRDHTAELTPHFVQQRFIQRFHEPQVIMRDAHAFRGSASEPEHEAAVVEMGVSHFGDMAPLAAMVQPTAMLFTIIGHAHLEFLRDRRGVLQEKTSVLDTMPDDAVAFCNGDDDLLRAMTCRQRKVTFGLSAGCDVRAVDVRDLGDEGSTCTIIAGTRRIPVRISAYGQHMVYAALEGAAVGIEYGLTDDEIIRGIAAYQPVGSRARVVRTARYTVIDDCYNANPDSTAAALRSMATLPAGRRVAVLGNMGELGTNAAALHRETGVCAAKAGVSLVITCGELARQIAAGAAAEDPAVATASFDTLDALLPALPGLLQPGDCVLVKASHSMQFERIVQALTQA